MFREFIADGLVIDPGVVWRSDTNEQLATYRDQGGIFIATSDNTFTFTGIHNAWTLNDGPRVLTVTAVSNDDRFILPAAASLRLLRPAKIRQAVTSVAPFQLA